MYSKLLYILISINGRITVFCVFLKLISLPITTKLHLVVNCDKDEWKIMVGNMKNDVSIWMLIKNQVAAYSFHTLCLCLYGYSWVPITSFRICQLSVRMKMLEWQTLGLFKLKDKNSFTLILWLNNEMSYFCDPK